MLYENRSIFELYTYTQKNSDNTLLFMQFNTYKLFKFIETSELLCESTLCGFNKVYLQNKY